MTFRGFFLSEVEDRSLRCSIHVFEASLPPQCLALSSPVLPPPSYFHRCSTHGTRKICHLTLFPIFWKALSSTVFILLPLAVWSYFRSQWSREERDHSCASVFSLTCGRHDFPTAQEIPRCCSGLYHASGTMSEMAETCSKNELFEMIGKQMWNNPTVLL